MSNRPICSGKIFYREYRLGVFVREIEGDELRELLQADMVKRVGEREKHNKSVWWEDIPADDNSTAENESNGEAAVNRMD